MSTSSEICGLTILRTTGTALATKRWIWNPTISEWRKVSYQAGVWFVPEECSVASLAELAAVLERLSSDACAFIVRGALSRSAHDSLAQHPDKPICRRKHQKGTITPTLEEVPRRWIMIDIDGWPLPSWGDLADDPDTVLDHAIRELLPKSFHDAECWWQLSSSAGFAAEVLKAHLFFWLSEPADNIHIKAVLQQHAPAVDRAPFSAAQPHYIAAPVIEGGHDPIPRRTGWRRGLDAHVVLPPITAGSRPARPATRTGTPFRSGGIEQALALLGDGEGLEGFHAPLRTATLRYARRCQRYNERNDEALKAQLRDAIIAAPRNPRERPNVRDYLADDYLRRLIDGAFALGANEPDLRTMRPHHSAPAYTVQQAREAVAEQVDGFLRRALDWHRRSEAAQAEQPAEHAALVVGVGVGKSRAAREAIIEGFIAAARGTGRTFEEAVMRGTPPHRVLWLVPTHKLGNEALAAMGQLGLNVAVMRGREADVPGTGDPESDIPAEKMCLNLDAVADALAVSHDVERAVCGSGKDGEPTCPFRGECHYQRQKHAVAQADVVITSHQALFLRLPKQAMDGVGLVIADESWWQAGILPNREVRLAGFADEPLLNPVLNRQRGSTNLAKAFRYVTTETDTNELHAISTKAQSAFAATPDGALVSKATVIAAGLTAEECAIAVKLEWRRKVEGAIYPGQHPEVRRKARERAAGNAAIPRRAGIWKALEELLASDATHTGRLEMGRKASADGASRVILLHSRRDVLDAITELPILCLDATMPVRVVKHFLPRLSVLAEVQAAAPHMTVIQITGGWGKTSLVPSGKAAPDENKRRNGLLAEVADFVGLNSGNNALVVTYQGIEDHFAACGIRTGHFNAISGLDTFRDVRSLFVIGRPLPAPDELLTMAWALTGRAIEPEQGQVETRGVMMADGTGAAIQVRVYFDSDLEALRAAITDAEVVQAIGRGRGVNRDADAPLAVFVLADVVLPLPVNRLSRWQDARPDLMARMLARGAVLFSPADAAKAYPHLFSSVEAAKKALQRVGAEPISGTFPYVYSLIGECPRNRPARVNYRPRGRGQQTRRALVTPERVPAFHTWIEAICGPLALMEFVPAEQQPAAEPAPAQAPAEPPSLSDPQPSAPLADRSALASPCYGIQPAQAYRSTVVNLLFSGGLAGLWTIAQADREPLRIVDRPMPDLVRSRLNRLIWLHPSGAPDAAGIAFLSPRVSAEVWP